MSLDKIATAADVRKPLTVLLAEYEASRDLHGKVFHHYKDHQDYQVITVAWDEETNDCMVVFCLCGYSKLKFTRRVDRFRETFIPGTYVQFMEQQAGKTAKA